jgi:hypothetical protein
MSQGPPAAGRSTGPGEAVAEYQVPGRGLNGTGSASWSQGPMWLAATARLVV